MTLEFSPRNCVINGGSINAALLPPTSTIRVYVSAPLQNGELNPTINKTLLDNLKDLFGTFAGLQLHAMTPTNFPQPEIFNSWLTNKQHQAYFEGIAQMIQRKYIGDQINTETIAQRLHGIKQRDYDPVEQKPIILSITELHNRFLKLVGEIDASDPVTSNNLIPELDTMFYNSLINEFKDKSLATLLNHAPSGNLPDKILRLQVMADAAQDREVAIKRTIQLTHKAAGRLNYNQDNQGTGVTLGTSFYNNEDNLSPPYKRAAGHVGAKELSKLMNPKYVDFATTWISSAETAMREVSGNRAPLKCWGCEGVFKECEHNYRHCPNKNDSRVQANYLRRSTEWRAPMEQKNGQSLNDPNRARQNGFVSKHAATLFNQISDGDIHAQERHRLCMEFINEYRNHTSTSGITETVETGTRAGRKRTTGIHESDDAITFMNFHSEGPNNRKTKSSHDDLAVLLTAESDNEYTYEGDDGDMRSDSFESFIVFPWYSQSNQEVDPSKGYDERDLASRTRTYDSYDNMSFLNTAMSGEIVYSIANELPHLKLPVGKQGNGYNLEGLFDTGGCSNLGWTPYFLKLADKHPQLIASIHKLEDKRMETIKIGGIGGRIEVTHILEMWMPYVHNGKPTKINIGLSTGLPITCIIGLPFHIGTKSVIDLDMQRVDSKTLGCSWRLVMKPPHRRPLETLDHPLTTGKISLMSRKYE